MEYIIVWGFKENDFMNKVNTKISEGWLLQGGVSVTQGENITIWTQAMIKTK